MRISKRVVLFLFGAVAYLTIEMLWRGHTHWTMGVLGGAMFLVLGEMNEGLDWDTPIWLQSIIGAVIITLSEFVAGMVLNVWLGLDIWDYSGMRWNICGQVCPQFFVLWVGLSAIGIVIDDYLRCALWGENHPRYTWTFKKVGDKNG